MKILFATSECAPFSKSGGLADVAFSLPPALQKSGDEIACITPLYKCVKDKYMDQLELVHETTIRVGNVESYCGLYKGENNGVRMWFIDNEDYFNRPKLYGYDDDAFRFAWFSRAVVDLLGVLEFMPDIIHCNDWETALVIIYLKNEQVYRSELQRIRTVYTIHNIAYQGQFGANLLTDTFALPGGWYDGGLGYEYEGRHDINLMKGAMLMADAVSTVSPTYAKELHNPVFGMGLEGIADITEFKTYGILNGIDMDHYDPAKDSRLPNNFSVKSMKGKAKNKKFIQKQFGLRQEAEWPLLALVARLNEQKGIELIKAILPQIMEMGVQLIIFGQGEQKYIDFFNWAQENWKGQLGFSCDYTEDMAAKIFASADMYLMPSRFEPCGLSQMMAMRYGTVPIVHETGGLKDSVRPYNDFDGIGDGFSFAAYNGKSLLLAIRQAVRIYFGDPDTFALLRKRCMEKDFSWDKSAEQYNRMYSEICGEEGGGDITFEEAFEQLKALYTQIDEVHRKKDYKKFSKDYHRTIQFNISGPGAGTFYAEFSLDKPVVIEPYEYHDADTTLTASFENYLGMGNGTVSADRLFMNGLLKVEGNISGGAEMRNLLHL